MPSEADVSEFDAADPIKTKRKVLGQLADLLDRNGIGVEDIGQVHRVNVWQAMSKDDTGNAVVTDLAGIQLSPTWESGPEWPAIQQAKPCVVRHSRKAPTADTGARRTAFLPDPQIGFRRLDDGTLIPMQDELAIACTLTLLSVIKPHRVVWLGDTMDTAEWSSKFLVLPEFVLTTQPTVDRTHRFLAESQAAAGPQCEEWDLVEGNHDNRMANSVAKNAMAALRLRQANTPDGWPVMSVPHLLRLDELGIRYCDGYPAGRIKIASAHGRQAPLYALHGEKLSMEKQAKSERISTVQGHAHHFGHATETYDGGDGDAIEVESWSLGCLCRTDGAVPSTKGGADVRGRHVPRVESWQQGIGVVTETEDQWAMEPVRIRDGRALWRGKEYAA